MKLPKGNKGNKGLKRKLLQETLIANREMKKAILAASTALDDASHQIISLRRILISERAQVIYYTGKYDAFLKGECMDLKPVGFLDLDETLQEPYVRHAIQELSDAQGVVPHDGPTVAKKIILSD